MTMNKADLIAAIEASGADTEYLLVLYDREKEEGLTKAEISTGTLLVAVQDILARAAEQLPDSPGSDVLSLVASLLAAIIPETAQETSTCH